MNIFLISVSAISTTLCGTETCATDTKAPESIAGAAIKLNEAIYSPSDITIERYEPDKTPRPVDYALLQAVNAQNLGGGVTHRRGHDRRGS